MDHGTHEIQEAQSVSTNSPVEIGPPHERASLPSRPPVLRTCSLDYAGTDSETEDGAISAGGIVDVGTESMLHHCRVCDNYFSSLGDLHFVSFVSNPQESFFNVFLFSEASMVTSMHSFANEQASARKAAA